MNMIGAGWILSAIWFIVEWPRPYSKGMWRKQWGWWFIVFLSVWLWACDDEHVVKEYVDNVVTEYAAGPYYTRTVYDENMGEFTAEQQDELRTKGYITMRLFYSPRNAGQIWVQAGTPSFGTTRINDVDYGLDRFVSVGDAGKIGYSTDSDTWTQAATPPPSSVNLYSVCTASTHHVTVGSGGKIYHSTDASVWVAASSIPFGTSDISKVAYNGILVVAVASDGKIGYSSDDGDTWTLASAPCFSASNIRSLVWTGTMWVAGGESSKIGYSTDADTWTLSGDTPLLTATCESLGHGDGIILVCGGGKIAYSSDAENWTLVQDSSFGVSAVWCFLFRSHTYVAGGNGGKIGISDNYLTWQQSSVIPFLTYQVRGLCYGIGKMVAVGDGGKIAFSID